MRGPGLAFLAWVSAVLPASADETLSLWLKSADRVQDETICVVARASDGSMTIQVQAPANSFPARAQPIPVPSEASAAFDAVLARIADGSIVMDEMNPDMPWGGVDGMELWLVVDGTERLARMAGLNLPPEVLALFDPLGNGACTRLANS
jgi:hypothetical protein